MNPKFQHRVIRFVAFLLLGILVVWISQSMVLKPINARESQVVKSVCTIASPSNANQLLEQGNARYQQGQFAEALDCWQQAEKRYQAAGDRDRVVISQINQAQAQQDLGLYPRACQTLLRAFGVEAQDCRQFTSDQKINLVQTLKAQPDSLTRATGLRSLGDVLRAIGNLDLSQTTLQLSLGQVNRLQASQEMGAINLSLGNTAYAFSTRYQDLYLRTQNQADAVTALEKAKTAIAYYQQVISQSTLPIQQIQAQLNQLNLLIDVERWLQELWQQPAAVSGWPQLQPHIEALDQIQAQQTKQLTLIQTQIEQLNPGRATIDLRINFSHSLSQLKQVVAKANPFIFRRALDLPSWSAIAQQLTAAVREAQRLQNMRAEAYALGYLGQLYQQTQQWSGAQTLTQQAIRLAQSVNAAEIAYQWAAQLGDIFQSQGNSKAAIAAYSTAVELLKSVRNDLLTLDSDIQFSFRDTVEPIYRKLVALLIPVDGKPDQAALQQALNTIDYLQKAELENFLQCNLLVPTVTLNTVVEVNDPQAAVIYPIILDDRLEIIVKLPNQPLQHQRSSVNRKTLEATLKELQTYLRQRDSGVDFQPAASQLYRWLIEPIEPYLHPNQTKTLVFVLDGSLRNVPMAVLYHSPPGSDSGKYLIEEYAIAITPGLSLLGPKRLESQQLNALVAGLTLPRQLTINDRQFNFAPLPNVKAEVQTIETALQQRVKALLDQTPGNEFTTERFRNKLQSFPYSIVHLATHGQFSSNPQETFIVTASGEPIYVNDLQDLLQAKRENTSGTIELIVFSACQTAEGDSRAALGMAGVAVRSGASSTLASLWSVDDQSTALLMQHFYKTLVNNTRKVNKAELLRRAQLLLLHSPANTDHPNYSHPYYWAPFVLIGNWL
ncbi:CHAT domain-containing protein [Leptodesmis sichuanensis]|uniref:CHAT domain-containing protein n=1 Tax=Leptodesmis sichuanensis TaxID=2906798 RepID=UPI001F3583E0|nr:CHAT domain-containing protein [Leptodesmis sichuanensis]UIE38130.1 CHAT domain-containing protein [Leptodesmis sichuanensis A121]